MQSGKCQSCCYNKPEEEYYSSYCGNCFQRHELPNYVECQHYRLNPGRCTYCGAIGPDDIQWKETCLDEDKTYEKLMQPVVERRNLDFKINSKKIKTYDNWPLCRGAFHSAKACVFRKHAQQFHGMKKEIQQLTQNLKKVENSCSKPTELLIPTSVLQEEDSTSIQDTDKDGQSVFTFDKILKALMDYQQIQEVISQDEEENSLQLNFSSETVQPKHLESVSLQTGQFQGVQEASCELTKKMFQNSICKILPDAADFPEDLFNVEGCIWCGSKGHDVLDCLGYITWLMQYFHLDQHRLSYGEELKMKNRIIARAREYHNPKRPWELYIGKEDREYYSVYSILFWICL